MIEFRHEDHTYWKDGKELPSVSKIIKDICTAQYWGVDPAAMVAASIRGQKVHAIVDADVKDVFDPEAHDFDLLPYYDAWRNFVIHSGFVPEHSEERVHSMMYQYAGTLDLRGHFQHEPKRIVLIDVKNTFSLMPSARVQTAGYEIALRDMLNLDTNEKIDRYVLHFKNNKCTLHPLDKKIDLKVFLAALTVHHFKSGKL